MSTLYLLIGLLQPAQAPSRPPADQSAELHRCADELDRLVAAVKAVPDPPSRVVWLATGALLGFVAGTVAAWESK